MPIQFEEVKITLTWTKLGTRFLMEESELAELMMKSTDSVIN